MSGTQKDEGSVRRLKAWEGRNISGKASEQRVRSGGDEETVGEGWRGGENKVVAREPPERQQL